MKAALILLIIGLVVGAILGAGVSGGILGMQAGATSFSAEIVLESIQQMSRLTTVRYNYSSVVTSQRDMPGLLATLYGERMLMVAVGHVDAGIDLSQLTAESITMTDDRLAIMLPAPVLNNCILNEQASYVVAHDTGIFARNAPNMDTEARRFALRQFRDMALEAGILLEASAHAHDLLRPLIEVLSSGTYSYDDIEIRITAPDPDSEQPITCQ